MGDAPFADEADLIEILRSGSLPSRIRAARELAVVGGSPAVPALREVLDSTDPRLQLAAGFALWRIERDPRGVRAVIEALTSGSPDAREGAVYALGAMGKDVLPFLDEALAEDPDRVDLARLREEILAQLSTS